MSIILPEVRFHTFDSPYHYTEDNKPLQDLADRDDVLKDALDQASGNSQEVIAFGSWDGMQASIDLTSDTGKPFGYRVRIWAIEDTSTAVIQQATLREDVLMGYSSLAGTVNILSTSNNFTPHTGTSTLTVTYTAVGSSVSITFSGYLGTNGYVIVRAERFGF